MKKILVVLVFVLMLSIAPACFALGGGTIHTWTNGDGDQDFLTAENWSPARYDPCQADDFRIEYGGGSVSDFTIIDSNVMGDYLYVAYGVGAIGEVRVTGGISPLVGGCSVGGHATGATDANGILTIDGGELTFSQYLTAASKGTGLVEVKDGVLGANRSNVGASVGAYGTIDVTGGEFNIETYIRCGNDGTGTLSFSGGSTTAESITLGYNADGNGVCIVSGGSLDVNEFVGVGSEGYGSLEVSGGIVNADRANIGQEIDSNGLVLLTGGEMNFANLVQVGREGTGVLTIEGDSGKLTVGQFGQNSLSTIELALNGSAGIGQGIIVANGDADLEGEIEPSFLTGTDTPGSYVVMVATGDVNDVCSPGILSAAAVTAGWSSDILECGAGQALMLTSPETATQQTWNSGTTTINSSISYDVAIVADDATATVDVTTGADAEFINLTVANQAGSTGQLNIDDGAVDVASATIIGNAGDAGLTVTGGEFSTYNLIAAATLDGSADIEISGDAVVDVENVFGLGADAELKISGYQTDITLGGLSTSEDSLVTLEFDGSYGIGAGVLVTGSVDLNGPIELEFVGDNRVDGVYTVLSAEGQININTEGRLLETAFCSYDTVDNGNYTDLRITVYTPESCQEIIDGGWTLAGDLNQDCKVNFEDFATLAVQWLWCNDPEDAECDPFIF